MSTGISKHNYVHCPLRFVQVRFNRFFMLSCSTDKACSFRLPIPQSCKYNVDGLCGNLFVYLVVFALRLEKAEEQRELALVSYNKLLFDLGIERHE